MNHSFETNNSRHRGELRQYPTGQVDEVYKTIGLRFSMGELAARLSSDPLAEMGCAYVQTVKDLDGRLLRQRYYFDEHSIYDPQLNQAAHLDGVKLDNTAFDITIGNAWETPIGVADGNVEAVVMPWTDGLHLSDASMGEVSPLVRGREALDWVAEQ